jgi:hypothetical protein
MSQKDDAMKLPPGITTEQFLEAVRQGVYDAVWQMITNNTDMPCADFYDTVKEAVKEGTQEGIENAMPFTGDIKSAITDGVREAMRGK